MDLPILFENKDIVVVNKPAGLVVHPDGRTKAATVVDWVLEKYPGIREVGEPLTLSSGEIIYRPGIVHRIDRDTSGVLVIAKNQEAFMHLKDQFQNRETHKLYNAFVYGNIPEDDGIIDRPIGRSKKDFRLWSAQRGARGEMREATTEFRVIGRGSEGSEQFSFLEVEPKTGRTHQIRVHMKAINHPVVCDPLYAPKRAPALGFTRLALHARAIEVAGLDGKKIKITAPLPPDFENALVLLGKKLEEDC
jgi:23S rRNA pseudouridine1911/1915/1917 synthase